MNARFRNVSDDPRSAARVKDTGLADDLRAAGFVHLGFAEDMLGQPPTVEEVLASDDGETLALHDNLFGNPHLLLRTLLEDGTVVETAFRRRGFVCLLPRPRVSQPRAGFLIAESERTVADALRTHRRRVRQVCAERRSRAVRDPDMHCWLAMGERATKLWRYQSVVNQLASIVLVAVGPIAIAQLAPDNAITWVGQIGFAVAALLGGGWLGLGRWLPVKHQPVAELFAAVDAEER